MKVIRIIVVMLIVSIITQEGTGSIDILWILIPLLLIVIFAQSRRDDGGDAMKPTFSDSWYTLEDNETTFKRIEAAIIEWRKDSEDEIGESNGVFPRIIGAFSHRKNENRFVEKYKIRHRLIGLSDHTGPIYFELTEVLGGGTVVKTTASPQLRSKLTWFKAGLPIRVPNNVIANICRSCGKPLSPEFAICPYCGARNL